MRMRDLFALGFLTVSLIGNGVLAAEADKAKQQAEIRKMAQDALPEFYKAQASLKADVEKAPGYAVFSTFGLSFIVGGSGGKGLAHDNKSGKDTFMHQAQGSVGVQAGVANSRTLIIFKNAAAFNKFIESGWDLGAGGGAGAAIEGKGAGGSAGGSFASETVAYTLTRTGLQAGVAAAGAKFWKDKDLN